MHTRIPRETSVDQAMIVHLNWMKEKCNELIRGFCLQGSFPLRADYFAYKMDADYVTDQIRKVLDKSEITEKARKMLSEISSDPEVRVSFFIYSFILFYLI